MNFRMIALWLTFAQILTGCGTTAKFVYPSNPQNLTKLYDEPKYGLKVAVLPFDEERGDENSWSKIILYAIPLRFTSSYKFERPDAASEFMTIGKFDFDVTEDLAKAVVASLKKSNLFNNVYFSYGGDIEDADLIINGRIKSTLYEGTVYSYGLSIFGPLLWILGLPAGTSGNELNLQIVLNSHKAKEPVWEYDFEKKKVITQGLYYQWGHDIRSYATLMEEGMNEAIKDLDRTLTSMPLGSLKR